MTRSVAGLAVSVLLLLAWPSDARTKHFTYDQVFRNGEPRLIKPLPQIQGWLDDDQYLELRSATPGDRSTKLLKIDAASGEESVYLDYEELGKELPKGFNLRRPAARSEDFAQMIFSKDNDLYHFDTSLGTLKRLTSNPASEHNARFSPDGKRLAYTRDRNLYVYELDQKLEHQITHDGSEVVYNGWASWVYYEEILGRGTRYAAFWWSPDSTKVAFLRFDDSPVAEFPIFHAEGAHGELERQRYPKAGDPNPWVRLGIAHVDRSEIVWVKVAEQADHYVAWPSWSPDSKTLYFQWMNRGQDNIKIYAADLDNGEKREIYDETQSSWVEFFGDLYFFDDGSGFLLRSDRDGWAHLYHYDLDGKLKRRLTAGDWRVTDIALVDEEKRRIYFHRTLGDATERHLASVDLDGKKLERHTKVAGRHSCRISPGGSYFIDRHSNLNRPARVELKSTSGDLVRTLGDQHQELLEDYALGKAVLFKIPSGDGYDLPAYWILPPDFDEAKRYPVVFRIYGGPGATTVTHSHRGFSGHYLAQNGIIVISVDHRGSDHFGKKGRALLHRSLGKWEMHDLMAAAKWVRSRPFVDPERIGITGGSYGGYTTSLALTYGAELFTHGVAHAPVTDWRLYDTVYTERYMDTPAENEAGYKFGSVMTHVEKYRGSLRLTHGTVDDNVHMQNTMQLIDRLTDLGKTFELTLYPGQRHGVRPPKNQHVTRQRIAFWFRHLLGKELEAEEAGEAAATDTR